MVIVTQLPEGPKTLAFEKNDPNSIGGVPLVRFVNYPPMKPTDKKLYFVKITFSKSVTKNFESFITGDMEAAIKLAIVQETILADLKLEDQVKATRALITAKKKSPADLQKPKLMHLERTRTPSWRPPRN